MKTRLSLTCSLILLSSCQPQQISQVVNVDTPPTTVIQQTIQVPASSQTLVKQALDQSLLFPQRLVMSGQTYELLWLRPSDPSDQPEQDKALQQIQAGQAAEALKHFEAAARHKLASQFNLANARLANGQISAALNAMEALLPQLENPWMLHNNQAVAQLQLGLYEQALEHLNLAIRLQAEAPEPYYHRGLLHLRLQELPRALESFDFALQHAPQHIPSQSLRAHVQARMGQIEPALEALNQVLELDPDYASAYLFRGLIHLQETRLDQALADFDRALVLRPQDPEVLLNRSLAHIRRNDLVQSAQDASDSLQDLKGPDAATQQIFVYENLAWIHLLQQDWQRAAELAQQALVLEPNALSARLNLAHAQLYQGQRTEALSGYRAILNNLLEGRPVPEVIQADWVVFRQRSFPTQNWVELARELGFQNLPKSLLPPPAPADIMADITLLPPPVVTASASPSLVPIQPTPVTGAGGTSNNGTINNALSALPEVVQVQPGRNASGVAANTAFTLRFSEPMLREQVEAHFSIRAYNDRRLNVDRDNGLTGQDSNTLWGDATISLNQAYIQNPPVWDREAFDILWHKNDTEVTFSFKHGLQLPSDRDSNLVPDYQVVFQSPYTHAREIQAKDGDIRRQGHFKLTDGPFEEAYKFAIRTDTQAPQVQSLLAQTAETGGVYGDALRIRFSEAMVFYTLSRVIAGGMRDRGVGVPESWREAPAGYPGHKGHATSRQAARNYTVQITPAGYSFPSFEGSWYELGGNAFYDPADPSGRTVVLTPPPGANLFQPGDRIQVSVSATVLDPAGNALHTGHQSASAQAG